MDGDGTPAALQRLLQPPLDPSSPAKDYGEDDAEEPRPSCSCHNSRCLKRYCNCFGQRWYCCEDCTCGGCENTEYREHYVEESAELILKNKPAAFRSKIAAAAGGDPSAGSVMMRRVWGCACRKSECRKNYCECFKSKVACTEICKCKGCANGNGVATDVTETDAEGPHNNGDPVGTFGDSDWAPDGSNGVETPDGSNGGSGETAVITDDGSQSPAETAETGDLAEFGEYPNFGPHVNALDGNGLDVDDTSFDSAFEEVYLHGNVHSQMRQGSAQVVSRDNKICAAQSPSNPESLTLATSAMMTKMVPVEVDLDEADQLQIQNISMFSAGNSYPLTSHLKL
ncbi:hypothetical protein ACP4OV_027640 [Aristida adscensionis]